MVRLLSLVLLWFTLSCAAAQPVPQQGSGAPECQQAQTAAQQQLRRPLAAALGFGSPSLVNLAGFSPIPYKVFTIAAGVAVLNFPAFVLASVIGRGARFFLVAGVVKYAGVRFEETLLKHIERIGWAVVVLSVIVIGLLMARG